MKDSSLYYTIRARRSGLCDLFAPGVMATTGTQTATFRNESTAQLVADKLNAATDLEIATQVAQGAGCYRVLPWAAADVQFFLVDPRGHYVATFSDSSDATYTADAINTAAVNADALALAAGALKLALVNLAGGDTATPAELAAQLRAALIAIGATPARAVGAISTGPGGGK